MDTLVLEFNLEPCVLGGNVKQIIGPCEMTLPQIFESDTESTVSTDIESKKSKKVE